jgi:hypothetical protein
VTRAPLFTFSVLILKLTLQKPPRIGGSPIVNLSHHRESLYFGDIELVQQGIEVGYPIALGLEAYSSRRWKIGEEFDSSINPCLQVWVDGGKGSRRNAGGESRLVHAASKQRMKLGKG